LSEIDHKDKHRDNSANRRPFNDDDKPSDSEDEKSIDHVDGNAPPKIDPIADKGRSTSRFRKNKREAKGGPSAGGDKKHRNPDPEGGRQKEAQPEQETTAQERHDGEENQEEDLGKETTNHPPISRNNKNCCMPVADCLASCFGGMGLGFRKKDCEGGASPAGRVVDVRMWDIIRKSVAFKNVEDKAFCINIGRLSDLQGVLGSAVKPFIKVHIVDIDTGHYIRPVTTGKMSVSRSAPVLTRQASLQGTASDVPQWNEDLCFPTLRFRDVVNPQNLILFEVLDDPPSLSFRKAQSIKSAKDMGSMVRTYTTLAWAFLLPVGQKVNVGYPKTKTNKGVVDVETNDSCCTPSQADHDLSLRLQLYQYKVDTVVTRLQRVANRWPAAEGSQQKRQKTETSHRYPDNIPEVYFQYKRKYLDLVGLVICT
jgi:hypothetical protein